MAKVKEAKKTSEEVEKAVVEKETAAVSVNGLKRIKVNGEELAKLQEDKLLVGYDPVSEEAIIKA